MENLPQNQQVTLWAQLSDANGIITKAQGTPTWAVDNSNILSITPSPDGNSCVAKAGLLNGLSLPQTANVTLTVDGLTSFPLAITVVASGSVTNVSINFGALEPVGLTALGIGVST